MLWRMKTALVGLLVVLAACSSNEATDEPDCETAESCATADAVASDPAPFTVGAITPTRYPIVLHHGFNASSTNSWSFYKVKAALEADGHRVAVTEVEPFNGVPARAAPLAGIVDRTRTEFCKATVTSEDLAACERTAKVNIIAHSMGGLDARAAMRRSVSAAKPRRRQRKRAPSSFSH